MSDNRYTQHIRRVLQRSQIYAHRLGHDVVGTEHVLLAIVTEGSSLGAKVLLGLGLRPESIELAVCDSHPPRLATLPDVQLLPLSEALQRAIDLALEEATWLGRHYIGTEHLLLGLVQCREGRAAAILGEMGVSSGRVRRAVRRLMREGILEISVEEARRMARVSEMARRILNGARYEALRFGHEEVGIEHVLLVLCRDQRNVAGRVMRELGVDVNLLRLLVSSTSEPSPLDEVLMLATGLAIRLGDHYTGTDHLLLAIAQHRRGAAVLAAAGLAPERVGQRLRKAMKEESHRQS
jgi:ATP-dependent Clp protease ATP-binding subunit ClpA